MPLYDIHRKEYVNPNYQAAIGNDGVDVGSEGTFYPLSVNQVQAPLAYPLQLQQANNCSYVQHPQMGFVPTFPTNGVMYNGGFPHTFQPYNAVPQYHPQPSFTPVLSPPTSGPSTPSQGGPSTPSPVGLRKQVQKASAKSKSKGKSVTRNAAQTAKGQLLLGKPKRQRGPNKRPPGTAFSSLLVRSYRLFLDNGRKVF
jgi:hypothetical protein